MPNVADVVHYGIQWITIAENERWFLDIMAYFLMALAVGVLIFLCVFEAPYGRYTNADWGFPVNAKLAWCLQETPAVVVPLIFIMCVESPQIHHKVNKILLSLYFVHYCQR